MHRSSAPLGTAACVGVVRVEGAGVGVGIPANMKHPGKNAAFTLIEMILVIALIGVISAVLLAGLGTLFPDMQKDSPREVLRKAVDAAWYNAAMGHGRFSLDYDEEANALVVRPVAGVLSSEADEEDAEGGGDAEGDGAGEPVANEGAFGASFGAAEQVFRFEDSRVTGIRFVRSPDEGRGSLQSVSVISYPQLFFSSSSGCTPARIEMDIDGETYHYRLEVFSGALEDVKE
ncbi:MAG: type II secretion system GspH family protein [Puniceicoccales bacterium]|jgi:prepilin-type N-terminal cleavage/methylation domain-containing protein|nr:type II secretion system GspH family protein [Puniceicoccales bacterium]